MNRYRIFALLTALLFCAAVSMTALAGGGEPLAPYCFRMPETDGRLSLSGDTVTLFAPGVTKTSGWYDVNKNWKNDSHLCWAASCSDTIAWYLDRCESTGCADVSAFERDPEAIFNLFRENWYDLGGFDPVQGMNWYFTGGFSSGAAPEELLHKNTGGYLRTLPHCGSPWFMLDPANFPTVFGDYGGQFPMVDDVLGRYSPGDPLYDHRSFSDTIRTQLSRGVCMVSVGARGASSSSSHAITLWGCDYDRETGLVSAVYVTDSDDEDRLPGHQLKRLGIRAKNPDREGVAIQGYYLMGSSSPITEFLTSSVFFSPEAAVRAKQGLSLEWDGAVRLSCREEEPRTVQLICAWYAADGRFLGMETRTLTPEGGSALSLPFRWPEGAARARAFVLDDTGVPLCSFSPLLP